jgi:hypothetical protein
VPRRRECAHSRLETGRKPATCPRRGPLEKGGRPRICRSREWRFVCAGGREAAELPTARRPSLLTSLGYPRGRTECPRSGASRMTGFRAGRSETPEARISGGPSGIQGDRRPTRVVFHVPRELGTLWGDNTSRPSGNRSYPLPNVPLWSAIRPTCDPLCKLRDRVPTHKATPWASFVWPVSGIARGSQPPAGRRGPGHGLAIRTRPSPPTATPCPRVVSAGQLDVVSGQGSQQRLSVRAAAHAVTENRPPPPPGASQGRELPRLGRRAPA